MANTIQIKRGTGTSEPSSLAEGELAINLDSGKLFYGSGSSVSSDFKFDRITAETYVISSSVSVITTSFSSGSTAFGDSAGDTHTFTGAITASGNISSSGTIKGSSLIGPLATAAQTNITSVGTLSALTVDELTLNGNNISSTTDGDVYMVLANSGISFEANSGDKFLFNTSNANNVDFQVSGENDQNVFYIDASADKVGIGDATPTAKLDVAGNINTTSDITASGTISASGTILANSATFGGGYGDTGATISTAGVGQFNGALTTDSSITCTGTILANGNGATTGARILLREGTDNGVNAMGFQAPAAVTATTTFTLPDGDGSANQVLKTDGSAVLAWTDMSGGTVGWHGSGTRIKILPTDFVANDGGRPVMIEDDSIGSNELFLFSHGSLDMFAYVHIPTGFKATHTRIYGSDTGQNFTTYEGDIDSKTIAIKGTATAIGTEKAITNVTSDTTNYLVIHVTSDGATDEIHGGYVTIEAV